MESDLPAPRWKERPARRRLLDLPRGQLHYWELQSALDSGSAPPA